MFGNRVTLLLALITIHCASTIFPTEFSNLVSDDYFLFLLLVRYVPKVVKDLEEYMAPV